ncbi:sensor histidine kinase [Variovorax sp. HJSM1_2]|uniref:sensor histidine kinase n=1 Tax=Variovorax sp. HJSM1_2 TaxID=3366263 RepID=UPI003BDBB822
MPGFNKAIVVGIQTALMIGLLLERRRALRAEKATRQQRIALDRASKLTALGEMTASIAHEVSQPLSAILSNVDAAEMLLMKNPPDVRGAMRIISNIRDADIRASDVVHKVRSLVRNQATEKALLDINAVIGKVVGWSVDNLERSRSTCTTRLATDLPKVLANQTQIEQVLLNLLLNSIDAVNSAEISNRRILITTRRLDHSFVEVRIDDNGPGFSEEGLRHSFESFFSTKEDGMGLGLAIAKSIVSQHGGSIHIGNAAKGGAVVRFTLMTSYTNQDPDKGDLI